MVWSVWGGFTSTAWVYVKEGAEVTAGEDVLYMPPLCFLTYEGPGGGGGGEYIWY